VDPLPPVAQRFFARQKDAVELALAAERSDDATEGNLLDAALGDAAETQFLADLLEA
jgi:hypothetical protein